MRARRLAAAELGKAPALPPHRPRLSRMSWAEAAVSLCQPPPSPRLSARARVFVPGRARRTSAAWCVHAHACGHARLTRRCAAYGQHAPALTRSPSSPRRMQPRRAARRPTAGDPAARQPPTRYRTPPRSRAAWATHAAAGAASLRLPAQSHAATCRIRAIGARRCTHDMHARVYGCACCTALRAHKTRACMCVHRHARTLGPCPPWRLLCSPWWSKKFVTHCPSFEVELPRKSLSHRDGPHRGPNGVGTVGGLAEPCLARRCRRQVPSFTPGVRAPAVWPLSVGCPRARAAR